MPFGFLRRKKGDDRRAGAETAAPAEAAPPGRGVRFEGLTDEWRLAGVMHIEGRLSEVLNRREEIQISDVTWAPIDGSRPFEPAPGLRSVDPYDLVAVLAGPQSRPQSEAERIAHRVRKVPYEVGLEVPPFRIIGTVHLHPGEIPERLVDQGSEMFVPLTGAVAYLEGTPVADRGTEVVLVNRLYIRAVEPTGR